MANLFQNVKNIINESGGGLSDLFAKQPLPTPVPTPSVTPVPLPTPPVSPKIVPRSLFKRVTYYLPTGSSTATGTTPKSGYTAAVSPDMLDRVPMGSLIKLPNGKIIRVEDKTNKRLKDTLDIFYNTKDEAVYPKGMERDVAIEIIGRDTSGMKYNY